MTESAIELAIKKLEELSAMPLSNSMDNDLAIQILNQSVMNSWQGLFPLKRAGNKQYAQRRRYNCLTKKCVLYFGYGKTIESGVYPPDERKEGVANDDYIF